MSHHPRPAFTLKTSAGPMGGDEKGSMNSTGPSASASSNWDGGMGPDSEKQQGHISGALEDVSKTPGSGEGGAVDDRRRSSSSFSAAGASLQGGGGLAAVVSRVVSRTTTRSSWNPGPPPDGGARAWLAVLGAHLVVMNTWGVINSFGVFQTYYVGLLARPPSEVAWIGSTQVFLVFFIGTFTGRLTDAGYFRAVFALGMGLLVAGAFATAQCTQYWHFLLAQGVCVGLGNGCLFCPTVAVMSTYFSRRRSLAVGLGACGSATGGLVYSGMVRQLLPAVGLAWTMRAIGLVQLATFAVAALSLRPRVPPRKGGSLVDWPAFAELEYTFYACGSFLAFLSVYTAFFYVAAFSRDVIGLSYTESLNLMLVLNGVGFMRVVPNYAADRCGVINMFILLTLLAGAGALAWMAVRDEGGLYAWTACFGIAAGGLQGLFPAGLACLASSDVRKTGVRIGMVFTIVSFAALTGPPIAGALVSRMAGSYVGAQIFSGATILAGGGFMVASRAAKSRRLGLGLWAKV